MTVGEFKNEIVKYIQYHLDFIKKTKYLGISIDDLSNYDIMLRCENDKCRVDIHVAKGKQYYICIMEVDMQTLMADFAPQCKGIHNVNIWDCDIDFFIEIMCLYENLDLIKQINNDINELQKRITYLENNTYINLSESYTQFKSNWDNIINTIKPFT